MRDYLNIFKNILVFILVTFLFLACNNSEKEATLYSPETNNTDVFDIVSHSYFENVADQNLLLEKGMLDNEIWNLIRINSEELPTGDFMMIPSFEYIRLNHKEIKAYKANASLSRTESGSIYFINYPDLPR